MLSVREDVGLQRQERTARIDEVDARQRILLGNLLVDNDVPEYDGSETWVDALLREPAHREALAREVRAVADEIAADPRYADEEPIGPDEEARERFREFARRRLASGAPND